VLQDVWCIGLQPTVRRNIPVRTNTQPRRPISASSSQRVQARWLMPPVLLTL
jgi:hypothetical protein